MKLTLDVGGSKTRGFLYAENRREQFEIQGGFGKAEDADEIEYGLFSALKTLLGENAEKITAAAVNLGGKNKAQIFQTLSALFPASRVVVYRESEGILAQRILQAHNANVLVMAGTGCILFTTSAQGSRVLGGWGKDYGDEGSGYSIGMKAVRYCLKELDSGKEKTSLLTQALFAQDAPFQFRELSEYAAARDAARSKIPKTREGVAALTKTVALCAARGCALSKRIFQETGEELAELVLTAIRAAQIQTPSVVVNGGVTNAYELWKDGFFAPFEQAKKAVSVACIQDGIDQALEQIVKEI